MYPSGDLAELAERKVILQARIDVRRWECAATAAELARPIAMIDRGVAGWRRIAPMVKLLALPAGILLTRFVKRHHRGKTGVGKGGMLAAVMSALPMVMRGVKMGMAMRAAHGARRNAR